MMGKTCTIKPAVKVARINEVKVFLKEENYLSIEKNVQQITINNDNTGFLARDRYIKEEPGLNMFVSAQAFPLTLDKVYGSLSIFF